MVQTFSPSSDRNKNGTECLCCQCRRGDDDGDDDPPLAPLTEPDRPRDTFEFCRCGMTNLGGGWGVHIGIEVAELCRISFGVLVVGC